MDVELIKWYVHIVITRCMEFTKGMTPNEFLKKLLQLLGCQ